MVAKYDFAAVNIGAILGTVSAEESHHLLYKATGKEGGVLRARDAETLVQTLHAQQREDTNKGTTAVMEVDQVRGQAGCCRPRSGGGIGGDAHLSCAGGDYIEVGVNFTCVNM